VRNIQGNRKQALADITRAEKLLSLSTKLTDCGCHPKEGQAVNNKLQQLIVELEPTSEELLNSEQQVREPQPEQPEAPGEETSGGEADA